MHGILRPDWPAPDNVVAGTTLRGSESVPLPAEPCWLNQVHGAAAVLAGRHETRPDADACVCRDWQYACVPACN